MTDRMYEKDAYCSKFQAVVCECTARNGKYDVVLDRTAFFPEGGGQAADQGTINGIVVEDVQRKGAVVIHVVATELKVGEEVECELDWELRYSRMQEHTGEHILSGVVNSLYGYDNVGFHMSDSVMTVDFNGSLSQEDIRTIEIKANEAVYKNADVVAYFPTMEELECLQYRSKKELTEDLRIVRIGEDIDCCACCAPHVAKTGEVGLIKVIDFYPYKQGTRIEMTAGKKALLDYMDINLSIKAIMKETSAPRNKVVDAVGEKFASYFELRNEYQKLSRRLALSEMKLNEIGSSVYSVTEGLSLDDLRYCINQIMEKDYEVCLLFSKTDDGYFYVVSSKQKDVRPIANALKDTLGGKGGGKSEYSQGKTGDVSEDAIRQFAEGVLKEETLLN